VNLRNANESKEIISNAESILSSPGKKTVCDERPNKDSMELYAVALTDPEDVQTQFFKHYSSSSQVQMHCNLNHSYNSTVLPNNCPNATSTSPSSENGNMAQYWWGQIVGSCKCCINCKLKCGLGRPFCSDCEQHQTPVSLDESAVTSYSRNTFSADPLSMEPVPTPSSSPLVTRNSCAQQNEDRVVNASEINPDNGRETCISFSYCEYVAYTHALQQEMYDIGPFSQCSEQTSIIPVEMNMSEKTNAFRVYSENHQFQQNLNFPIDGTYYFHTSSVPDHFNSKNSSHPNAQGDVVRQTDHMTRSSCDNCVKNKRKCDGGRPFCKECEKSKKRSQTPCHYGIRRKPGPKDKLRHGPTEIVSQLLELSTRIPLSDSKSASEQNSGDSETDDTQSYHLYRPIGWSDNVAVSKSTEHKDQTS